MPNKFGACKGGRMQHILKKAVFISAKTAYEADNILFVRLAD
jgi:hypothetical protein